MTRINYWCYLQDNKITGKMEIQWGVVLFARGQSKGSTLGHAAFLMKFILKQLSSD